MNPWELSASELMIWGLVAHLIADWPLQNDWMARNKMLRRQKYNPTTMTGERGTPHDVWWDRHPASYVHAAIHGVFLAWVFAWGFIPLVIAHLLIDTRKPVVWWSKFIGQTQPLTDRKLTLWPPPRGSIYDPVYPPVSGEIPQSTMDVGMEVRFWNDQVFHIVCIAILALVVGV